jgi:hypothetical protein
MARADAPARFDFHRYFIKAAAVDDALPWGSARPNQSTFRQPLGFSAVILFGLSGICWAD